MKIIILILNLFAIGILNAQYETRNGKDHAIFFYVTKFQDPGWVSLPETQEEINSIANELKLNYGFQVEVVPNPTKKEILKKIEILNENKYNEDDQILFFFSTHGYYNQESEQGFLIPSDGKKKDKYGKSWLSYDDLGSYIALNPSQHILLALDACHSGAFGIRYKNAPNQFPWEKIINDNPHQYPNQNKYIDCNIKAKKILKHKSRLYFSSGDKNQRTPSRSLFAKGWLEMLRRGQDVGILTTSHLWTHLNNYTGSIPDQGEFVNHEEGGEFIFIHKEIWECLLKCVY